MNKIAVYNPDALCLVNVTAENPSVEDYAKYIPKGKPFWIVTLSFLNNNKTEEEEFKPTYSANLEDLGVPSGYGKHEDTA